MKQEIPKIQFAKNNSPHIEVMTFAQLVPKLDQAKGHDSFVAHKIEFYLILVVTKNSYSHFVDFESYKLSKGSALFVAKNQVHHFTKDFRNTEGYCIVFNSYYMEQYQFLSKNLKLTRLFNYHIEKTNHSS